jgi:hypothetical protein
MLPSISMRGRIGGLAEPHPVTDFWYCIQVSARRPGLAAISLVIQDAASVRK